MSKNIVSQYIVKFFKFKNFLGKEVWRLFLFSIIFGLILFITESSFILVLQGFLGSIGLVAPSQLILPAWYPRSLLASVIILTGFGVFRGIALMTKTYIGGVTGQAFIRLQRSRALEYGLNYSDNVSSTRVVTVFTERISQAGSVLQTLSQLVLVGTSSLLLFFTGLKMAPIEMLISIVVLAIFMYPLRLLNIGINKAGEGVRLEWEVVNGVLLRGLRNNFLLKIYGLLSTEINAGIKALERNESHFRYYYKVSAFKSHLPNIIGVLAVSCVTYISINNIHTPSIILISFFYLFIRLAQSVSEANGAFSELRLHFKAFKEIYHWHEFLESLRSETSRLPKVEMTDDGYFKDGISIEARDLNYSYPDKAELFYGKNFSVSKGDVLLIKGESGVGKSTLLLLLLGFLKPSRGSVLVNSKNVEEVQSKLLSEIAYVGPDPFIINGSLKDNLKYGHLTPDKLTQSDYEQVLIQAQLDVKAIDLDYQIGEQGSLSTGQRQRVAIARALLRKPKLLILDEATANLDSITERNFIASIKEFLPDVTTIIISHKSSFDDVATQLLELKKNQH